MNCCKNQNEKEEKSLVTGPLDTNNQKPSAHRHRGHLLHMLLCCGLPLIVLLVLPLFGYKGILQSIVPFLCPIMMLIMIPIMMRGQGSCNNDKNHR